MATSEKRNWTRLEVEGVVTDYLDMHTKELTEQLYNKSAHRRNLQKLLDNRSDGSVERKHQNISAVLIKLGLPSIKGYKPNFHYQRLLYDVVRERVEADQLLHEAALHWVEKTPPPPRLDNILDILVAPPTKTDGIFGARISEPGEIPYGKVDYIEKEARNQSLGRAGELLVLDYERARLSQLGEHRLAQKIEHVAETIGDSVGFDVRSFDVGGKERLIEVKTTKSRIETPFFVSRNQLETSQGVGQQYHLYRLFEFDKKTGMFNLAGALDKVCRLTPTTFLGETMP